jgi:tripartite-type tricarboxylate transporter receptor subunit TctC
MSIDRRPHATCARRRGILAAFGASALQTRPGTVLAANGYPVRAITVIVPFPAGGTTDALMRTLLRRVARATGHAFAVENRPGASTLIAAQALKLAAPDGYTIGVLPMILNRLRALGRTDIDVANDFSFIARIVGQTHGLVVRSTSPYLDVKGVIAAAKRQPGAISYGTSGVASTTHVAVEDFAQRSGIHLRHIPFKGGTESFRALLAGDVALLAESPIWADAVDSGRCRLLATWNAQRVSRYPATPTMSELGHPTVFDGTVGLGAPAGIDLAIMAKLRAMFRQAIFSVDFKAACDKLLAPVRYLDGDDFRQYAENNFTHEKALAERLKSRLAE